MQAIILAGGEGIKLRPLTFAMPKPLLPLVNKPIIDYIIHILKQAGITSIIITVDYLAEEIKKYLAKNNFGIPITIHKINNYQGTANILLKLKDKLEDEFLVVPGDALYDMNLGQAINNFKEKNAVLGLFARRETDILGKGGFVLENTELKKITEKKDTPNILSDAWIYYFKKTILDIIPSYKLQDIHLDLIKSAYAQKLKIIVQEIAGFWAVIGRVHPYMAANFWILQNIGSVNYIGAKSKIAKTAKLIEPYFIDEECEIKKNVILGPNVILCKNVKIAENTKLNNAIIHRRTQIGQNCVLENCIVSDNNKIRNKCKIGQLAIIAPNCEIGARSIIDDGARVGPNLKIANNSLIQDFIFPTLQLKDKNKTQMGLNPTEFEIYLNLQKAGEQTFSSLNNLIKIPQAELQKNLDSLISKKIIVAYGTAAKMFALAK